MKRVLLIVGIVVVVLVVGAIVAVNVISRRLERRIAAAPYADVDLSQAADGVYEGSFEAFPVSAAVRVTVHGRRIVSVEVTRQQNGPGRNAADVPARIVAAQSPKVDATSGATYSSRAISAAVYNALAQQVK